MRDWGRTATLASLAVIGATIAAALVWTFGVPEYVRRVSTEAARRRGVAVEFDRVKVSPQAFALEGVTMHPLGAPELGATADAIDVALRGWTVERIVVERFHVAVASAAPDALRTVWQAWKDAAGPAAPANAEPAASLVFEDALLEYEGILGAGSVVRADHAHLEATPRGRTQAVRALSESVTLTVRGMTLGPWRLDLDETDARWRLRATLDPGVPEAASGLVVGVGTSLASIDFRVARTAIANLGVPRERLGPSNEAGASLAFYLAKTAGGQTDITTKGGLYNVVLPESLPGTSAPGGGATNPAALDVTWEGAATGNAASGMVVRAAHLAVGPLTGEVQGTFRTFDAGFAVDLGWRAAPVPCAKLTFLGRPEGSVGASASLTFDTRDPDAASLHGLAIQGSCYTGRR